MLFAAPTITRKRMIKLQPRRCVDQSRWVWPLPAFENVRPRIVNHANDSRLAVDIGYGDARPTETLVPVYAVHDGTIELARKTATGFAMVVDHHGEWSSYYAHLSSMICSPTWDESRPKVRVCAGSLLGFANADAPIRFELWKWSDESGFVATPPEAHLATWTVLQERNPLPSASVVKNTKAAA